MNLLNQASGIEKKPVTITAPSILENIGDDLGDWTRNSIEQLSDFDFSNSFSRLLGKASDTEELRATQSTESQISNISTVIKTASLKSTNIVPDTDPLSTAQNALLSTLGLSALDGDGSTTLISQLTSASGASLEKLQSSLLADLQSSLFNSFINPTASLNEMQTNESSPLNDIVASVSKQSSLLTTVSNFSFGDNGMDLTDGFDAVNVLQHIPVISSIYQNTTGDTIDAAAKLGGGFLYGGTAGLAFSAADLAIEYVTGTSISDKIHDFNFSELLFSASNSSTILSPAKPTATPQYR
jgi:hypothetical protein